MPFGHVDINQLNSKPVEFSLLRIESHLILDYISQYRSLKRLDSLLKPIIYRYNLQRWFQFSLILPATGAFTFNWKRPLSAAYRACRRARPAIEMEVLRDLAAAKMKYPRCLFSSLPYISRGVSISICFLSWVCHSLISTLLFLHPFIPSSSDSPLHSFLFRKSSNRWPIKGRLCFDTVFFV
jgi:hypothetical protein